MAVKDNVASEPVRSTGTVFRLRTLALVLFNVALALGITLGLIWLAGRPGVRQRLDLTADGGNTLDLELTQILDRLPGEIRLDSFFRPFDPPLQQVGGQIQEEMFRILLLAKEYRPGLVEFRDHPYATPGAGGEELLATMRSFGLNESNTVVVSTEDRKAVFKLLGDVAEIDLGNPISHQGQYRPPELRSFVGQEALAKAILKATQGERPLAIFSQGRGEREIFSDDDRAMGRLHTALVDDGFRVETWDPEEDGEVPEGCAVLAIVGAEEPFSDEALGWIAEYVRGGGSMIAAPGLEFSSGQGSVADLLTHFGILTSPGIVCRPIIGADGLAKLEDPRVAGVVIRADGMLARHPITEPLRQGGRRVRIALTRSFERGRPPTGGSLLDLLRADELCWEEVPDARGNYNYMPDQGRERGGPFSVAMTSVFPPTEVGPAPPPGTNPLRPECRALALGSSDLFASAVFDSNRDFLLNAFNWAASREFRVSITPQARTVRRLDLGVDRTLFHLGLIAGWTLPLLCFALVVLTWLRRRR